MQIKIDLLSRNFILAHEINEEDLLREHLEEFIMA